MMESVPVLLGVSLTALALAALLTGLLSHVSAKKIKTVLLLGVPCILLVAASAISQYQLYLMRPAFFDLSLSHLNNGWMLLIDALVGFYLFCAFEHIMD